MKKLFLLLLVILFSGFGFSQRPTSPSAFSHQQKVDTTTTEGLLRFFLQESIELSVIESTISRLENKEFDESLILKRIEEYKNLTARQFDAKLFLLLLRLYTLKLIMLWEDPNASDFQFKKLREDMDTAWNRSSN